MSFTSTFLSLSQSVAWASLGCAIVTSTVAFAEPLGYASPFSDSTTVARRSLPPSLAMIEPNDAAVNSSHLGRRIVGYSTRNAPGTIVIDSPNTYLYFVLGGGKAIRYAIGVGRRGFAWSGVTSVARKAEWPDWIPPAEMLRRQPYLPRFVAGGPGNPLGARALYLSGTLFRIHGTNDPSTIGKRVSSGCIRMLNDDVVDLYTRVKIGTKVIVLPIHLPQTSALTSQDRSSMPGSRITVDTRTLRAHGLY